MHYEESCVSRGLISGGLRLFKKDVEDYYLGTNFCEYTWHSQHCETCNSHTRLGLPVLPLEGHFFPFLFFFLEPPFPRLYYCRLIAVSNVSRILRVFHLDYSHVNNCESPMFLVMCLPFPFCRLRTLPRKRTRDRRLVMCLKNNNNNNK